MTPLLPSRTFALRMALREWRAHPGALAFFAFSVALGVACLVATETVSVSLEERVKAEGRTLLGGDLELRSRRPFPAAAAKELAALRKEGVVCLETVETLSMVQSADGQRARLCSLKAVGLEYPIYGSAVTEPPQAWAKFHAGGGVLVAPALGLQMRAGTGDALLAGRTRFTVLGELAVEPDHLAEAFQLGPRLMLRLADLPGTGLIAPGSRATYRAMLKLPDGADATAIADRMKAAFPKGDLDVTTAEDGPEGTRRLVTRVTAFLGLAGFAVLLLSGVGTAVAIHTYVAQRLDSLAILKCLGLSAGGLVGLMLVQTLSLAIAGSVLGAGAGAVLANAMPGLLSGMLPFDVDMGPRPFVIGRGFLVSLSITLGFCLLPLLSLRKLSVAQVLRRQVDAEVARRKRLPDRATLAVLSLLLVATSMLVLGRAGSRELAGYFLGGFAAATLALALAARLLLWLMARLTIGGSFSLRHALANIYRPGNQTTSVVVAVGLGVFLLVLVHQLRGSMLEELAGGIEQSSPNLFIIDIQPDQKAGVENLLRRSGHPPEELVPLVRSRLTKIAGKPTETLYPEPSKTPWWITRDYWLSYREGLKPTEELVAGRIWTGPVPGPVTEVSVEERTAERLGVGVGDTLTLDIAGLEVTAQVTSLRRVKWSSMRPNFFLLFPTGVLEGAPQTWFAVTRAGSARERAGLTRDLVDLHPNLTIIDVTNATATIRAVLERVSWVLALVAAVCLAGGGLVLIASVLLTRRHRLHEMALYKLLGATRGTLLRLLAIEYAVLGAAGGAIGSLAALWAGKTIALRVFEVSVTARPEVVFVSMALSTLFVTACGALASAGLLRRPPQEILRSE